jgi:hypothetical protein
MASRSTARALTAAVMIGLLGVPSAMPAAATPEVGAVDAGPRPTTLPFGNFEELVPSPSPHPGLEYRGWAWDPDYPDPTFYSVYVDAAPDPSVWTTTAVPRPDVVLAYPGAGLSRGFDGVLELPPGPHTVCIFAQDIDAGAVPIGCRTATVPSSLPVGNFESLWSAGSNVTLSGWALDLDAPLGQPVDVHVYVNGSWGGATRTDVARADVAAVYVGAGILHGFTKSFTAGPGTHQVCAYAIDPTTRANTALGCRWVTTGSSQPMGNFEALTSVGSTVTLSGWALDPDVVGAIDVHVYVNGAWGGAVSTVGVRADVGAVYPGTGDLHGFTKSFTAGPGTHQVCAYAIDSPTTSNTPLGCRTITVP